MATRVSVIEPSRGLRALGAGELWRYRTLILALLVRQVQVRYAQSILGVGWSVVRPLLSIVVFTIVFDKFARIPSDGQPYVALLARRCRALDVFRDGACRGGREPEHERANAHEGVFPRLALPIASALAPLVDLGIGLFLLVLMMTWFGVKPAFGSVVVVPVLVLAMMLTAVGVGCAVAAVDVQYRDARRFVPFVLQLWMYLSPVVYPASLVPERYRGLYALNPLAGIIGTFRSSLLSTGPTDWRGIGLALASSSVICAAGVVFFRNRERVFADVV